MSKISAPYIGLEHVSTLSLAETSNRLPEKHGLLPDGQAVATHTGQLYPVNNIQRQMMAFADPSAKLVTSWRNDDFRHSLAALITRLRQKPEKSKSVSDAVELLQKLDEEQSLLQMTLHLLHKV